MKTCTFCWFNKSPHARAETQQFKLFDSCRKFNIRPILYLDYGYIPKFGDILKYARKLADNDPYFMYINSDCVLTQDPFTLKLDGASYGLHKKESADNSFCPGVDGYLIPTKTWDTLIVKDIPDMFVGVTHIDWWLTNTLKKHSKYYNVTGYLDHETHVKAAEPENPKYMYNLLQYNAWARRSNLREDSFEAHVKLALARLPAKKLQPSEVLGKHTVWA